MPKLVYNVNPLTYLKSSSAGRMHCLLGIEDCLWSKRPLHLGSCDFQVGPILLSSRDYGRLERLNCRLKYLETAGAARSAVQGEQRVLLSPAWDAWCPCCLCAAHSGEQALPPPES